MAQDADVESRLKDVVAHVARLPDASTIEGASDLYRDLGVQSTAALDLLLSLEDEFEVAIPDEDFGEARTISALTALVLTLLD